MKSSKGPGGARSLSAGRRPCAFYSSRWVFYSIICQRYKITPSTDTGCEIYSVCLKMQFLLHLNTFFMSSSFFMTQCSSNVKNYSKNGHTCSIEIWKCAIFNSSDGFWLQNNLLILRFEGVPTFVPNSRFCLQNNLVVLRFENVPLQDSDCKITLKYIDLKVCPFKTLSFFAKWLLPFLSPTTQFRLQYNLVRVRFQTTANFVPNDSILSAI